ncbi:MAG: AAA family ATPase [Muribaculaceae bacterium]|nr:AAA family ATPase [Muribaculaceae bacterium]
MASYLKRLIDTYLNLWAISERHKPLLLRGARQVGKSTAVRELGRKFRYFVEINFERNPEYMALFETNLDVERIIPQMAAICGLPIEDGNTLLFLDEIQACPKAIMALRFFKEDRPALHVIAAGSLLELALQQIPTFGVGRIHSMFMYPMTFDEFLEANNEQLLMQIRNNSTPASPLPDLLHNKLTELFRTYLMVGGMPEAVQRWVDTHDYLQCQEVHNDILISYEDDFPKYNRHVDPILLRLTLHSAAVQVTHKFSYADVGGGYRTEEIKRAVEMLILAGLIIPVTLSSANGLPLGSESNHSFRKMLILDQGIMLRILSLTMDKGREMATHILTSTAADLVNKGPMAEMTAGLELRRYRSPDIRQEMFYWARANRNAQAEIDYLSTYHGNIVPIEIKAGARGGMKSMWIFMREKQLNFGVRSSLENFASLTYIDAEAGNTVRNVTVCPLYALSQLDRLIEETDSWI